MQYSKGKLYFKGIIVNPINIMGDMFKEEAMADMAIAAKKFNKILAIINLK